MEHLTIEEMIEFATIRTLNDDAMALIQRVNDHIISCRECREKVEAIQLIFDELCRIGSIPDPQKSIYKVVSQLELDRMQKESLEKVLDELEIDGK